MVAKLPIQRSLSDQYRINTTIGVHITETFVHGTTVAFIVTFVFGAVDEFVHFNGESFFAGQIFEIVFLDEFKLVIFHFWELLVPTEAKARNEAADFIFVWFNS